MAVLKSRKKKSKSFFYNLKHVKLVRRYKSNVINSPHVTKNSNIWSSKLNKLNFYSSKIKIKGYFSWLLTH